MDVLVENYLLNLPNEILIRIVACLDTNDLMNYIAAYPEHSYFLNEKHVIRNVNLCRAFDMKFSLKTDLVQKINPSYIKVLNINGVYWIPADELHFCIKKLCNLECLYVLDTKLYLSEREVTCLQPLTKLQKIAICIDQKFFTLEAASNFPNVKSLMVHLIGKDKCPQTLLETLAYKSGLEELWIIDKSQHLFCRLFSLAYHMKKFAYRSLAPIAVNELQFTDMYKVYENRKVGYIYLEKGCKRNFDIAIYDEYFQKFWDTWNALHCFSPYGVEDAKGLIKNDIQFYFKELNFCHEPLPCCTRYVEAISNCLRSSVSRKLLKLSLQICLFRDDSNGNENAVNNAIVFDLKEEQEECQNPKKRLLSIDHPLSHFALYFTNLKELEIWPSCNRAPVLADVNYDSISLLQNLEKFTITVTRLTPHDFISDVFRKCEKLQSFRVTTRYNEPFMKCMCANLKYTKNLRDFRCETSFQYNIDKLIEGLNEKEDTKLQRLVVKSPRINQFSKNPLAHFFLKNPQLIFVYLILGDVPDTVIKKIRSDLRSFKTSPKQLFFASKADDHPSIPEVHRYEIISFNSCVAVCNVYDDFIDL